MAKLYAFVLAPLVLTFTLATSGGQTFGGPETVVVHNGSVTLHAMLWRPQGRGPFPAILLNHGSGRSREELERLGPYERNAEKPGPVFCSPWLCIPVLVQARCRAFRGSGPKRRRLNEQGIRRTRTGGTQRTAVAVAGKQGHGRLAINTNGFSGCVELVRQQSPRPVSAHPTHRLVQLRGLASWRDRTTEEPVGGIRPRR
jgi:hypothetical protein